MPDVVREGGYYSKQRRKNPPIPPKKFVDDEGNEHDTAKFDDFGYWSKKRK